MLIGSQQRPFQLDQSDRIVLFHGTSVTSSSDRRDSVTHR